MTFRRAFLDRLHRFFQQAGGTHVEAGQPIAEIGCGIVGASTGPHIELGLTPPGQQTCCPAYHSTSAIVAELLRELYAGSS